MVSLNDVYANTVGVYPNPFDAEFQVQWALAKPNDKVHVVLYNLNGKRVYAQSHTATHGGIQIQKLEALPPALYVMELSLESGSVTATKQVLKK